MTFGKLPETISYHFHTEYGHADVKIAKVNSNVDRLFAGLGDEMSAFMSHYDKLVSLPTVSQLGRYFRGTFIDSSRGLWLLLLLRTPSTPASPIWRNPSLVCPPLDVFLVQLKMLTQDN